MECKTNEKVWESIIKYEKVWESLGKYEKVWESLGNYEKVWESLGTNENVCNLQMKAFSKSWIQIFFCKSCVEKQSFNPFLTP